MESFISSLPDSFFDTPRDTNPLANLKLVDLTIDSSLSQLDLRAYLVDWLSDSLATAAQFSHKQLNMRDWRFPKFGNSPNSTPPYTPPPCDRNTRGLYPDETTADEDIANVVRYTEAERAKLERLFQEKLSVKLDKEIRNEFGAEEVDGDRKSVSGDSPTSYRPVDMFKKKVDSLNLGYRILKDKPVPGDGLTTEQQQSLRGKLKTLTIILID